MTPDTETLANTAQRLIDEPQSLDSFWHQEYLAKFGRSVIALVARVNEMAAYEDDLMRRLDNQAYELGVSTARVKELEQQLAVAEGRWKRTDDARVLAHVQAEAAEAGRDKLADALREIDGFANNDASSGHIGFLARAALAAVGAGNEAA